MDSSPLPVDTSNVGERLVTCHDTFLFDMDGVLFVGANMIARANEAVRRLTTLGKLVVFITNNTTKSRKAVLEKYANGIEDSIEVAEGNLAGFHLCASAFIRSEL